MRENQYCKQTMPSIAEIPTRKRRREEGIDFEAIQKKVSSSPRHASLSFHPSSAELDHRRYVTPRFRPPHELKRQRILEDSLSHTHPETHVQVRLEPKPKILNPCHICHRKPTVKSDLDSYADCEGCGNRTCYICIRECLGGEDWGMGEGHKGMVCSRCCVERGTDGEVLCLECLRREGGG